MASRGQDLIVNLVARTQQFGAQLRSAGQSLRNFGDQAQTTSQRASSGFDVIGDAAKAYVGVQGVRALYDMALAGGALEDSIKATSRSFGSAAGTIGQAAQDSAERWGLTEQQFRQMSANVGMQLQNFGFSADEAADATLRLTDRARDMASQAGLPMQQAIDAIGAALRGERDPIEQFGVAIKDVDIQARLAAQGMSGLAGEARKTAEAQAAIDIIFQQSADSVGAFANSATADVQQFQASIEQLQAELGQELVPALGDLAEAANDALPAVVALMRVLDYSANPFDVTPVAELAAELGVLRDGSDIAGMGLVRAEIAAEGWGRAAGRAAGTTEAAGGAATRAGRSFASAAAGVNTFAGALSRIAGSVFSSVDAQSRANSAIQSYNQLVSGSGGGGGGGGAAGATRNLAEEQKKAAQNARRMQEASEDLADAQADLLELETELADLRGSLADKNLEERRDAEGNLEDAQIDSRSAALDLKDAEDELKRVRRDSESSARDIERAEIALDRAKRRVEDAALRVAEAEQEVKEKRRGNTNAAKELQEAEDAVADAQERVEDATIKAGDAYVQAIKPAKDLTSALGGGGGGGGGGLAAAAWEVEAAAADAAREVVDAARDFLGFRDDALLTRDATQAWIDKIDELTQDVAPGSPLRRYLDELIGVLENLQRTAPTNLGTRLGAPVGGVPGRQQNTLGGGATTVTVNLDGRKVAEAVADANRNSGGFIN